MRVVRGKGGKVLPVQVPGNHPDRESVLPGAKNRRSPDAGAAVELERRATLLPEGLGALMPGNELACVFFFNDAATAEIYTLSLHDALPIYPSPQWGEG